MNSLILDLEIDYQILKKSIHYKEKRDESIDLLYRFYKDNPNTLKVPVFVIKHFKSATWEL